MNDFVELRHVISIVLRRWWLLVVMVISTSMLGYAISQRQMPIYEATTTILVGQAIQSTNLDRTDILTSDLVALTYVEMVKRQPVLQGVVDSLSLNVPWQQLKTQVLVNLVEGTQLIQITVEASSPEAAEEIADEVASQMILLSPTNLQSQENEDSNRFIRQQIENLRIRIESGQSKLTSLESEMLSTSSLERSTEIRDEIIALEKLIIDWEHNYTQLFSLIESNQSPNDLTVIEPAQADPKPVRPQVRMITLLSGGLGIGLALGLIFLFNFLDDTFKSSDELSRSLSLPTLGGIQHIKGTGYMGRLVAFLDPFSSASEAYRMIGSNLKLYSGNKQKKTIMVTSPNPAEGKSLTTANLGLVLSQAGLRTIIVDLNVRRPAQHQVFQITDREGLAEFFNTSSRDISDYIIETQHKQLGVLTVGRSLINPSELLSQNNVERLITGLTEMADIVIFDGPPVVNYAEGVFLSAQMDGVILVVKVGQTSRDTIQEAIINLQQGGAKLFGSVLNCIPSKKHSSIYSSTPLSIFKKQKHIAQMEPSHPISVSRTQKHIAQILTSPSSAKKNGENESDHTSSIDFNNEPKPTIDSHQLAGTNRKTNGHEAHINLNTAREDELKIINGIGPIIAQRIIEYREKYGPLSTIEEIERIPGIGAATLIRIKGQGVEVPLAR